MEKLVYNAAEVAESLGICKPEVYQLFKRADFPSVKLSERRVVVPVDALKRWLNQQSQEGGQ